MKKLFFVGACTAMVAGLMNSNVELNNQAVFAENKIVTQKMQNEEEIYSDVFNSFQAISDAKKQFPDSESNTQLKYQKEIGNFMNWFSLTTLKNFDNLVYTFLDIDENGTKEMLIGIKKDEQTDFIAILTKVDGKIEYLNSNATYTEGNGSKGKILLMKDGTLILSYQESGLSANATHSQINKSGKRLYTIDSETYDEEIDDIRTLFGYKKSDEILPSALKWKAFKFEDLILANNEDYKTLEGEWKNRSDDRFIIKDKKMSIVSDEDSNESGEYDIVLYSSKEHGLNWSIVDKYSRLTTYYFVPKNSEITSSFHSSNELETDDRDRIHTGNISKNALFYNVK